MISCLNDYFKIGNLPEREGLSFDAEDEHCFINQMPRRRTISECDDKNEFRSDPQVPPNLSANFLSFNDEISSMLNWDLDCRDNYVN